MAHSETGIVSLAQSLLAFVRHNINQVFAGKFVYFLSGSILAYLTIVVMYVLDNAAQPGPEGVYYILMFPAILLLLYPSCYAIQGDADSRMLETIFGIPDYRYKVWLVRMIIQYLVIAAVITFLVLFSEAALADFDPIGMVFQLMFPVIFLSSLGFMLATMTRSGNGTATILIVVILFFWISAEWLDGTSWDLFHNPFAAEDVFEEIIWREITLYNRIYLMVGGILSTMFALLRMQKRERFI